MGTTLSASGRIGRRRWWITQICVIAALVLVMYQTTQVLILHTMSHEIQVIALCSGIGTSMLFVWISATASIKRYHDRNKSALWLLIGLIPIIGQIWQLIELGALPANPNNNEFENETLTVQLTDKCWMTS